MPDFHARWRALTAAVDRQPIRAELPTVRGDAATAMIRLYDPIDSYGGWWGTSAKEFAQVLDELPPSVAEIRLLINSPGGEVFEGIAILNLLRAHPARVVAVVEGLAASAASFIATGVDELVMARNTQLFIHDAWGLCVGPAADMRQIADELDRFSNEIASIYADKAGGTVDDWRQQMAAETWFSAEEAVAAGLADQVDAPVDPAAQNRWPRVIFARTPRDAMPGMPDHTYVDDDGDGFCDACVMEADDGTCTVRCGMSEAMHSMTNLPPAATITGRRPAAQVSATQPSPSPEPGQEGGSMPDLTELRDALGLAEDTSDDDVVVAALDRLTAPPDPPNDPALPEGVVAISEQTLAELRADAQAGRDARAQQIEDRRAGLVAAAVDDGRIAPAERDAWLAKLESDTGAEQVLAALKPGLVPVAPVGSGGSDLETVFDDEHGTYSKLFGQEAAR